MAPSRQISRRYMSVARLIQDNAKRARMDNTVGQIQRIDASLNRRELEFQQSLARYTIRELWDNLMDLDRGNPNYDDNTNKHRDLIVALGRNVIACERYESRIEEEP
jgi:hypothetical protein